MICENCNLYFKSSIPSDAELYNYYNSIGDGLWDYSYVLPHEAYLKDVLKKLPDRAVVLDVGCNTGRLLEDETKRLKCFGTELNKRAADIAQAKGITILASDIKASGLPQNTFDLITLVDVFEHLNDPLPFIDKLIGALTSSGKLYVFTGRTDCLPARISGAYYWYYKIAHHIIFLNKEFVRWYSQFNKNIKVTLKPMRHFYFNLWACIYQISWHLAWRFLSPNSPYKIIGIKRLKRLKEPFMITSWKDHVFLILTKN
jgi:SAM-dependent methyltransferase